MTRFCHTVDGRNPAPVEVGNLSHNLRGLIHPRWCRISSISCIKQGILRKWYMLFSLMKFGMNSKAHFPLEVVKSTERSYFFLFECLHQDLEHIRYHSMPMELGLTTRHVLSRPWHNVWNLTKAPLMKVDNPSHIYTYRYTYITWEAYVETRNQPGKYWKCFSWVANLWNFETYFEVCVIWSAKNLEKVRKMLWNPSNMKWLFWLQRFFDKEN